MKTRSLKLLAGFMLAAVAARADINIENIVGEAKVDIEKAPAIVAKGAAAAETPGTAVELLTASVTAIPDKTIEIVCAVCKVLPKLSPELVRAALDVFPDRSAEIVAGVTDCIPPEAAEVFAAAEQDDRDPNPPPVIPDPVVSPSR